MSTVTISKVIPKSSEQIWSILADFGGIHRFHPAVARSPLLSEQTGGLGARRQCEFYDGNRVVEEVTEWEEGKKMGVDIVEGTMPLRSAHANITVTRVGQDRTKIVFEMRYEPKFGLLGKAMDAVMMRSQFKKILGRVLDGLQLHSETGAIVGQDGRAEAAA